VARRKGWESLSPDYRGRLSRRGITKSQYEHGRPLSGARGHGATPEHGLQSATRTPAAAKKYGDYIRKRTVPGGGTPVPVASAAAEDEAYELNQAKDAAYLNIHSRLKDYYKYKRETVLANVYGGETPESGEVSGMSLAEARWTAQADTEELRAHATPQYQGNPWFYH
jgi:hypothetical protein